MSNKVKIIGLCGTKGSGKDTAAEPLLDKGWARISFADPLKDLCAATFNVKPAKFHHPEFKDLKFHKPLILGDDHADNFMAALDDVPKYVTHKDLIYDAFDGREIHTARELMQFIGTDVVRHCVSNTYWVDLAEKKIKRWSAEDVNIVFTDVRMANERDLVKDYGGTIVRILREGSEEGKHSSEIIDFPADITLTNDESITDLHKKIIAIEEDLK